MLDSLKIENFKGIKSLEIPELGQINLITGKNNTCKTSVLEAVSILVSGFDLEWVTKLIRDRNELKVNEDTRDIDYLASISTLFTDNILRLHLDTLIGDSSRFYLKYNFEYLTLDGQKVINLNEVAHQQVVSVFAVNSMNGKVVSHVKNFDNISTNYFSNLVGHDNFQYVNSSLVEDEHNAKLWDNLAFSDNKKLIINALNVIDEKIEQIEFVQNSLPNKRKAIVKVKGKEKPIILKSMGDGINRILTIALAMVNAENGYLFIDEVENGLHYSVQVQLWETIFYLAKKLNVQVFATTHSSDTVAAFSHIANEKNNEGLGKYIRLSRKNDEIKAIGFDNEELLIAEEQNIEIR